MGMLNRLRDAHPDVVITAFDGHYARIGDDEMGVLSHLRVERGPRHVSIPSREPGRRKAQPPRAVEARLERLITEFERKTM